VPDARAFCAALEADGVLMGSLDAERVRAVTHLDVDDAGIERALEAAARAVGPARAA
jgi:threonine aldolase